MKTSYLPVLLAVGVAASHKSSAPVSAPARAEGRGAEARRSPEAPEAPPPRLRLEMPPMRPSRPMQRSPPRPRRPTPPSLPKPRKADAKPAGPEEVIAVFAARQKAGPDGLLWCLTPCQDTVSDTAPRSQPGRHAERPAHRAPRPARTASSGRLFSFERCAARMCLSRLQ